jgi:hypothetical protein
MQAAFGKANLSGYVVEGNRIRIPRGQQSAYLGALADSGALPANFGDYLTAAVNKAPIKVDDPDMKKGLRSLLRPV